MIQINNVSKQFSSKLALDSINCTLSENRVVLFGPSGSGKTTLLRLIAKLDDCTNGSIDMDIRCVSMVFQKDFLLNHLSAFDNIAYGLDHGKFSKEEIQNRVNHIAKICHVDSYINQKARTLSGGQRQRVSLARALIKNPDLLLMDEAFSHLDVSLKNELMDELLNIVERERIQLIYVTHDVDEAKKIGKQFVYIKDGKLDKITNFFEL